MATRIIGKVAFRPRGNWDALVSDYERLDTVVEDNVMYIALQNVPAGTPVSDSTYWQRSISGSGSSSQLDTAMSDTSTNGVQNRVIKAYVDEQAARIDSLTTDVSAKASTEYVNGELDKKVDKEDGKGLSTNDFTDTLKTKLDGIATGANKTTVDTALSSSSTNPVQNKVVNTALGNKVDKVSGKGLSTNDFTAAYKTKLDGIGSFEEIEPTADIATTHQTAKSVVSKQLPAGTYIVTGQIRWAANSAGVRIGGIATSADSVARDLMLAACPSSYTVYTITKLIQLTKTSTIYLNAYHNAGSGVSINVVASGTYLRIFRIA